MGSAVRSKNDPPGGDERDFGLRARWMVDGFSFLFSVGLLALAGLAAAAAWPAAFVRITQGLAVLGLASVVWNRIGVTLLVNADVHLDYPLIGLAILAVIAGIAAPLWSAMLARTLSLPESTPRGSED